MSGTYNYQHISRRQPFITVVLVGVTLSKIAPTGDGLTKLVVSRVGLESESLVLLATEQTGNNFTFAATEELLTKPRGRYTYKMYYRGDYYIGQKQFILEQVEPEIRSV